MNNEAQSTRLEYIPVNRPDASAPGSILPASEPNVDALLGSPNPVVLEIGASPGPKDAQTPRFSRGDASKKSMGTETPKDQKAAKQGEAPEVKEQRAATKMEHVVTHTKTYLSDMRLAHTVAGQRLGGQSVTGRILEGAAVTGIGVGLEKIVQSAFSSVLGEILGHVRGLGGKADGVLRTEVRLPEARAVEGGPRIYRSRVYQEPIDKDGNTLPTDIRTNLHRMLSDQLKAKDSRFRTHLVNALMEGFDDTAVLAMYGLTNRITGNMLPRIPTEYYGASLALDFVGIGLSPNGTKTEASIAQTAGFTAAQPSGIRAELKKGVERGVAAGQKALNFSNPVSLYGLSVMKGGVTTYLDTLKAIRTKRKDVESGKAPRVYVGEGAPHGYRQEHRLREQRRDNRQRGYQGRKGSHG